MLAKCFGEDGPYLFYLEKQTPNGLWRAVVPRRLDALCLMKDRWINTKWDDRAKEKR